MEPRDEPHHAPILVAFDPASAAREPVAFGIAAHNLTGAPLIIVAVRPGGPVVNRLAGPVDDEAGGFDRTIEHLRTGLQRRKVDATVRVMSDRSAAAGLDRAMTELQPELVVVGATHRSAGASALVGTTAERVLHASHCPVAVIPKGYERPSEGVRVIGAAFSPTPEGRAALSTAASLARTGGVALRGITVVDPKHADETAPGLLAEQHHEISPERASAARERLTAEEELRAAVRDTASGLEVDIDVLAQDPASGLTIASEHVDLLVMGSRAYGPKRAVLLGSVSRRVAAEAACPVLIVPRGAEEASEALAADAELHGSR